MDQPQEFNLITTCVFGIGLVDESDDTIMPLSARDHEAADALPAGSALLIVQRGPSTGVRFLLDAEATSTGRSPESDIFLDDVAVSRSHCQFIAVDGGHVVRDSGSLNDTYVDRERVDSARLSTGDEVQIGKYRPIYQPSSRTA